MLLSWNPNRSLLLQRLNLRTVANRQNFLAFDLAFFVLIPLEMDLRPSRHGVDVVWIYFQNVGETLERQIKFVILIARKSFCEFEAVEILQRTKKSKTDLNDNTLDKSFP